MSGFVWAFVVYFIVLFSWTWRSLWAIKKTGEQRIWLIGRMPLECFNEFDDTSFNQHKKALFWGRDPRKLYSERIQKLLEKK